MACSPWPLVAASLLSAILNFADGLSIAAKLVLAGVQKKHWFRLSNESKVFFEKVHQHHFSDFPARWASRLSRIAPPRTNHRAAAATVQPSSSSISTRASAGGFSRLAAGVRVSRSSIGVRDTDMAPAAFASASGGGALDLAGPDVHLVVSTYAEDITWLAELDVPTFVYVHDRASGPSHCYDQDPARCPRPDVRSAVDSQEFLKSRNGARRYPITFLDVPNVGDEASALLSHVLVYYDRLPKAVVLLHGHRTAWHAPFDMPTFLQTTSFVPEEGYRNLNSGSDAAKRSRCHGPDWEAAEDNKFVHQLLASNWNDTFAAEMGLDLPSRVCVNCCAQFVVSRERLLRYSHGFYKRLRHLVSDGRTSMEREWRLLFVRAEEIGLSDAEVTAQRADPVAQEVAAASVVATHAEDTAKAGNVWSRILGIFGR